VPYGVPHSNNNKAKWISKALEWLDENNATATNAIEFVRSIHDFLGSDIETKFKSSTQNQPNSSSN
jgi:predicted metal-dependent hydrolase